MTCSATPEDHHVARSSATSPSLPIASTLISHRIHPHLPSHPLSPPIASSLISHRPSTHLIGHSRSASIA
ncbi:MAG: hypothetical protein MJY59_00725 [Bacteroidaceae bacterium]|nr:hypothetical protein [Bacteroidaceae bacterium]